MYPDELKKKLKFGFYINLRIDETYVVTNGATHRPTLPKNAKTPCIVPCCGGPRTSEKSVPIEFPMYGNAIPKHRV